MAGAERVAELTPAVIAQAQRETRFPACAVWIDATVVGADVRYPTEAGLTGDGVRTLAGERKRLLAIAHAGPRDGRGEGGAAQAERRTGKLVGASA